MGFSDELKGIFPKFKEAGKAGADFNPLLKEVTKELEKLHGEGKLSDVLAKAEETYNAEHAAYKAKGNHTNAEDNKNDVNALKHFVEALKNNAAGLPPELKDKVEKLSNLEDKMMEILGKIGQQCSLSLKNARGFVSVRAFLRQSQ